MKSRPWEGLGGEGAPGSESFQKEMGVGMAILINSPFGFPQGPHLGKLIGQWREEREGPCQ